MTSKETKTLDTAAKPTGYMPGLDVARGAAIVLVLVDHGLGSNPHPYEAYHSGFMLGLRVAFQMGQFGVHLFFILSGFLITGILLSARADADYYRNFYLRRVLRILPAYLLMVAVLAGTRTISLKYVAVCLLYLCNMPGLLGAAPEYGPLWSLSVEEQFYLVWPFAVRRLSTRRLTQLAITLVLLTPLLRFALQYGPHATRDILFKPWALGDFFAVGALLCIASRAPALQVALRRAAWPLLLAGVAAEAAWLALPAIHSHALQNAAASVELEPWLLLFSGVVLLAWLHPEAASRAWARPLVFLGKISYGLYLCHLFIFRHVEGALGEARPAALFGSALGPFPRMLCRFAIETALAIAVAALSRYSLEAFFLRMKPKHDPGTPVNKVSGKIA